MCIIWFLWLGSAALYSSVIATSTLDSLCPEKRVFNASTVENVRQLYVGSSMNFTMERNQQVRMFALILVLILAGYHSSWSLNERLFASLQMDTDWKKQVLCLAKVETIATPLSELGAPSLINHRNSIAFFPYNLTSSAYEIFQDFLQIRNRFLLGGFNNGIRTHRIGGRVSLPEQHIIGQICSLQLQESVPLVIQITSHPQAIVRRLFYNETINMTKHLKLQKDNVVIPCATNGRYDLILTAKRHSFVHIDVLGRHPSWNWKLLNETNPIRVRFQNRMQKKQMIIKWSKSKLDIHAMHYCIIINTKGPQKNFCSSLQESLIATPYKDKRNCLAPIESIWLRQKERIIDPHAINVICTGSKPNQIVKGLIPNMKYYVDIYGVHTKKQNLTILLKSASTWFNRTHPGTLRDNMLTLGKIAGSKREREAIFSYKIPYSSTPKGNTRFLILPCSGSQIDVKILKRRLRIRTETDIYKPTYVPVPEASPGDRLILRVKPSNVDEFLHANKVGIAVTMTGQFKYYPELPSNTSLFLSGSYRNCDPKIAWYPSQDERRIRYCVIIFRLPNNSRSSADETNYCLDFGKNVMDHPQFYERNCYTAYRGAQIEQNSLLNLIPGDSYLVYVTLHLIGHNYLPYESLKVNIHPHCRNNTDDVLVRAFSHYDK